MKDALTRMQEVESKFRAKAAELDLDLDKLYAMQSVVPNDLILKIEEDEPSEENMFHSAECLECLIDGCILYLAGRLAERRSQARIARS